MACQNRVSPPGRGAKSLDQSLAQSLGEPFGKRLGQPFGEAA